MTRQEAACLTAIDDLTINGVSPTYDQIAHAIGLASKSGVARIVDSLERQGRIRREPRRARSLSVVPVDLDAQLRALVDQHGEHAVRLHFAALCAERDALARNGVAA